jgi:hypothetical protein
MGAGGMPHDIDRTPTDPTASAACMLADHLDAMLAAGEDLTALAAVLPQGNFDGTSGPWDAVADMVRQARLLETALLARALQARARARDLGRLGGEAGALLKLFVGGTTVLVDAVAEIGDRTGAAFDTGLDPFVYLRTRGLVPADAGSICTLGEIRITDAFQVCGKLELGLILDMAASMLDALETLYRLFPEESRREDASLRAEATASACSRALTAEGKSHGRGQARQRTAT